MKLENEPLKVRDSEYKSEQAWRTGFTMGIPIYMEEHRTKIFRNKTNTFPGKIVYESIISRY